MQRQVPTWLAVVIILAVIVVVGVVYWLLMPKPSSGVGGQVTATAIPPQPLQR
jgi:ABC-type transporter Mla subunit MlaD